MATEDEIDQYEYFVSIAESLGLNVWRNSGRFVLLEKGGIIASFPNTQELCQFINGVAYTTDKWKPKVSSCLQPNYSV